MIARRWHGRIPAAKAEEYLALTRGAALPDFRLEREPTVIHFTVL